MHDLHQFQSDFDPRLNPGLVRPETAGTPARAESDSFVPLWAAFLRKHELARTRAQVDQDTSISPEDRESLLRDLKQLEGAQRHQLILFLHQNGCRPEIEALIAHPGRPAHYYPEDGFYIDRVGGGVHLFD